MSTKRKRRLEIISYEKGNVQNNKKELDYSSQAQIGIYQLRTEHLNISNVNLIPLLLPVNKYDPKEDSNFYWILNLNEFKIFNKVLSNNYRNSINSSNGLNIFSDFSEMDLHTSQLSNFLIIYILNILYKSYFLNLFYFFYESVLNNSLFLILLNNLLITTLNLLKKCEEKRREKIYFIIKRRE